MRIIHYDTILCFFILLPSITTLEQMKTTNNTARRRIHWIVRPPQNSDQTAIESLLRTSYENLLAKDYDSKLLEIALPRLCSTRPELLCSSTWYVAEHPETGAILGCGGWTPQSPMQNDGDTPHLRHFATHPDYTRQGIARALWERTWKDWCDYYDSTTEHHGRSDGHPPRPRPDMEVFSTLTAESFYASLGFQKIQDVIIPLSDDCPFPSILMRRPDTLP